MTSSRPRGQGNRIVKRARPAALLNAANRSLLQFRRASLAASIGRRVKLLGLGPQLSLRRDMPDILIMDDEFLKQRAQFIRDLADKADPFIKRRLMDLAINYDARIARPARATVTLLSNDTEIGQGRGSGR